MYLKIIHKSLKYNFFHNQMFKEVFDTNATDIDKDNVN